MADLEFGGTRDRAERKSRYEREQSGCFVRTDLIFCTKTHFKRRNKKTITPSKQAPVWSNNAAEVTG